MHPTACMSHYLSTC